MDANLHGFLFMLCKNANTSVDFYEIARENVLNSSPFAQMSLMAYFSVCLSVCLFSCLCFLVVLPPVRLPVCLSISCSFFQILQELILPELCCEWQTPETLEQAIGDLFIGRGATNALLSLRKQSLRWLTPIIARWPRSLEMAFIVSIVFTWRRRSSNRLQVYERLTVTSASGVEIHLMFQ